jgi:hypothetical protein
VPYDPNANWTAKLDDPVQGPVYYIVIDGLTAKDYATGPVANPATPKALQLGIPHGSGRVVEVIEGTATVETYDLDLLDLDGDITSLITPDAAGAPLPTIVNRKVSIFAGYRDLEESDYAEVFVGRIRGLTMNRDLTGYVLKISDVTYLLDGEIMSGATNDTPATIRGNIVHMYASILRDVFSTSDPDFPLDFVSTDTATTSAPTGLGVPDALINFDQLKAQRDLWHIDTVGEGTFFDPEDGREHLEAEFFRIFQCWPARSGDGLLGLRFHVPALPPSAAAPVSLDHIVEVRRWERLLKDHLNEFQYFGDYDGTDFVNLNVPIKTEDTDDQAATEERVLYRAESRWMRTAYNGEEIATEMAGRLRLRYQGTPALMDAGVTFRARGVEQGDVVAVTHPDIPNLRTGDRGLDSHLMTVISIKPDFPAGLLIFTLLDTGLRRYGVIGGDGEPTYDVATAQERNTFFYICSDADLMSDGSEGYRFI